MKHFFEDPSNPNAMIKAACGYVEWWGRSGNCLQVPADERGPTGESYGPGSKLQEAVEICQQAPAVLELSGPRGPGKIICVFPERRAVGFIYTDRDESPWVADAEVGGFTRQPVAQYVLKPGSPSRWISGCYSGGAFALTPEDAERIGFTGPTGRGLPRSAEEVELFGTNVEAV